MVKTEDQLSRVAVYFIAPIIVGAYLSNSLSLLDENSGIPLTIFQVSLICSFFAFIIYRMMIKDDSVSFPGLEIRHFLFITIIFASLIYSPERGQGIFFAIRYLVLLFMSFFIFNIIKSKQELKVLVFIVIGISAMVAIHAIIQFYLNPEIAAFNYLNEGKKLIRIRGTESDPNIFASSFFMPVFLILAYAGDNKSYLIKTVLYGLLGVMAIAVILTYSRSTWVALFFGISFIILRQRKFHFIYFSVLAVIVALFISETARNIVFSSLIRIQDIFSGSEDDSSNVRLMLLSGAISMFIDSYGLGVGFQAFSTRFLEYFTIQQTIGVYEPHNEFYTVLAELGIIGFVIFCYIIFGYGKIGYEAVKARINSIHFISLGLFTAFIGYLIFYQFYGGMLYNSLFFINLGLMFSLSKFKLDE